jgi:histone-arginine methyltransferase CARM1
LDMQGRNQAVNLVNGMIVDGLGHVSLDSGNSAVPGGAISQANIHQGSIPATGRVKDKSQMNPPMSAANSLQFNQLIGGATSPIVIQNGSSVASTQASSVISPTMIGDYMCKPQH